MARQDDRSGLASQVLTIDDPILSKLLRGFLTVDFYSDAACTIQETPTAGSYTVQVKYRGSTGLLDLADSPADATNASWYGSWQGPVEQIVITPTGITGPAYIKASYTATGDQ